jgi:hypothetical protein
MNNLNETIGSIIDADRVAQVMLERESLLSDITRLTHALDAIQGRQKKKTTLNLKVIWCS